jgi:hypothetical protein
VVGVDYPLQINEDQAHPCLALTFELEGPSCPFWALCFDCRLVSDVWKATADLSMVIILSWKPSPSDHISLRRLLHWSTLSFLGSFFNSLGTQRTDVFTRPMFSDRIWLIVSYL